MIAVKVTTNLKAGKDNLGYAPSGKWVCSSCKKQ